MDAITPEAARFESLIGVFGENAVHRNCHAGSVGFAAVMAFGFSEQSLA